MASPCGIEGEATLTRIQLPSYIVSAAAIKLEPLLAAGVSHVLGFAERKQFVEGHERFGPAFGEPHVRRDAIRLPLVPIRALADPAGLGEQTLFIVQVRALMHEPAAVHGLL